MIEEFGSIPLTNGSWSGSRRPKNIRIWIFFRIRICNTAWYPGLWCCTVRTPWPTPPPPSPSCWRIWARRSYSPAHRSPASRQEAVSSSPLIDRNLRTKMTLLKGSDQWKMRGVGKLASFQRWVLDRGDRCLFTFLSCRRLFFNIFPFPVCKAQLIPVGNWHENRQGALNTVLLLLIRQY